MGNIFDFEEKIDIAWCPGCGDYSIRKALLEALQELNLKKEKVVLVSGIGQAAKMPQYINTSFFNGLHGRGLPPATAIKACNPELTVIAVGGDGDMYGEGGNHFLHATRRNPDITLFVHENMVYGLTKGQAAPTSRTGMKTPVQVFGVFEKPLNPIALAISLDVTFVARVFCGDIEQTKDVMKKAILHKGFALVDIFQPCVTFNKINTFKWFKDNTYYLSGDYDPSDRTGAFKKSLEEEPFPLGIIYKSDHRTTFEENISVYKNDNSPLYKREFDIKKLEAEINAKV
ncbi:MAG: 2-oxoacid ferredoxin oxidoreductase [Spirochaetae bacterium HGW-Spirochaetae-5]|nr:MAG: 2-oxoacid ferredoxin oxidoreductase [Spirochaetae bacterium HGW-Spirochaetae-5]